MGKIKDGIVKIRKAILKEITNCHKSRTQLGVYCSALGNGMLLTAVEDIYQAGQEMMVVFKWYDNSAHIHSVTHVSIDEIHAVCQPPRTMKSVSQSFIAG